MANDVIPGLDLEFFSNSDNKPITVSVLGDTEVAKERIHEFVDAYNTFQATAKEVSKYDKSTNTAAPLLSDRNLAQMVNEIANTTIATDMVITNTGKKLLVRSRSNPLVKNLIMLLLFLEERQLASYK
mgnify:CR=1 FL=1